MVGKTKISKSASSENLKAETNAPNSGSIQARFHASATTSQQRHKRNSAGQSEVSDRGLPYSTDDLKENNARSDVLDAIGPPAWPSMYLPMALHEYLTRWASTHVFLAWTAVAYVLTCILLFTVALFSAFTGEAPDTPVSVPLTGSSNISPLELLPIDYLTSKITTVYPPPNKVLPNVISAKINDDSHIHRITACVWTDEAELDSLRPWVSRWTGPISLLLTTSTLPSSPESLALMERLSSMHKTSDLDRALSAHILHKDGKTPENPNAYLNLARLFASTPQVILFPGNLSHIPPKTFHRSFFSNISASAHNASSRPIVFTTRSHSSYPFSPLSPIVLNRDDPLWCTERSFLGVSREADWNDCLWQLWLEHFGNLDIKQTTDWVNPTVSEAKLSNMETKLRRRFGTKFRSETCMLATRQLAALRTLDRRGVDAKKTRWLKRQCREWMILA
ncbi:hypothetical protein K474DRAFT_1704009 [Panus rudis PR-1116 ss-1]|nr:hypothetical protein K474DRAFT_1704009 [Panus rudis PR-1116 ss-1]